jgi:Rod binding domain-containing protein
MLDINAMRGVAGDWPEAGLQGAAGAASREAFVARQFEALILTTLISQMRQASSEDGLFPGDRSDTFGGMFDQFLADHIAQSGGLGLAESLGGTLGRPGPTDSPESFAAADRSHH